MTDSNVEPVAAQAVLEPRLVGEIVGDFVVPGYQRGYRWGEEEVRQLLDDIHESDGNYYLQPIVVKPGESGWELIDGQQRLTTLYLIVQILGTRLPFIEPKYSLSYVTRPNSTAFLRRPTEERSEENIDFFFMFQAAQRITEWFEDQIDPDRAAMNFYLALTERVYVIWYQAPLDLDSRALFTRLNVGRIPLTDAELVKAVLLSSVDRPEQVAAQWDGIERDLRSPELWAFATGTSDAWATHISLLLDTLARRYDAVTSGTHHTFEALRRRIAASAGSARDVWEDVVDLHSALLSWYDDPDLFHKIGFLVLNGTRLAELFGAALDMTRSDFESYLDDRIRQALRLTRTGLADIGYEGHTGACRRVLELVNVETVRRRNHPLSGGSDSDSVDSHLFERYSFAAHVRQTWSLEHIHAQSAEHLDEVRQWTKWLELHRDALLALPDSDVSPEKRAELVSRIEEALPTINTQTFFQLEHEVVEIFTAPGIDADGVHTLSNLALLGGGDNSALNNSCFAVKRRAILELDRAGSFIPPATRNAFLKYYTESEDQQIHFWGPQDRASYMEEVVRLVEPYLQPEKLQQGIENA